MSTLDSAQPAQVVDTSRSPFARLHTLPLDAVNLAGGFWEPRRRINREVTLPSQYRHLEDTGRLDNFPYYAWANREPGTMRIWLKSG